MWRSGRLIVDTGIHAEHNINTEVDRYISGPGQAMACTMGELKILELRRRAESSQRDAFDIRAFHDAVLENGALLLPVLKERVDDFIAAQTDTAPVVR